MQEHNWLKAWLAGEWGGWYCKDCLARSLNPSDEKPDGGECQKSHLTHSPPAPPIFKAE